MEIEHGIAGRLERLTAIAREQGNETLANLFAKANELVHSCIRILKPYIERLNNTDNGIRPNDRTNVDRAKRVNSGFVAIETPHQLEVTASYGVKSSSTTTGGGSGPGVSMEVVQIRSHRVTAKTSSTARARRPDRASRAGTALSARRPTNSRWPAKRHHRRPDTCRASSTTTEHPAKLPAAIGQSS